jgi:hypothetical protein
VDIDTLQQNLEMVTFCNAGGADVAQYADPNFVKVFQLAQLMLEYNLYTTVSRPHLCSPGKRHTADCGQKLEDRNWQPAVRN